mmetsp:Transcript_58467/g.124041  ORF Transcript_58467/g.124041 Transcript_58467/m.124041 type:complete len:87 (-) Transcript_58467:87-347(-)
MVVGGGPCIKNRNTIFSEELLTKWRGRERWNEDREREKHIFFCRKMVINKGGQSPGLGNLLCKYRTMQSVMMADNLRMQVDRSSVI